MRNLTMALLLLASACGSKTADQQTTTSKTVETVQASAAQSAHWPAAAPAYAPPYPGGVIETAVSGMTNGDTGMMVTFTTRDPGSAVAAFYMTRAKAAGLKQAATMEASGTQMVMASNPDTGQSVTVQSAVQDGKTQATLIIGKSVTR